MLYTLRGPSAGIEAELLDKREIAEPTELPGLGKYRSKSTACECQRSAAAAFRNFLVEKGAKVCLKHFKGYLPFLYRIPF